MRITMELGMIGLGRMGANMSRRMVRGGHRVVGYDLQPEARAEAERDGIEAATSIPALIARLESPRILWLMLPAALVDGELARLVPLLQAGDVIVDGGNSHYHDDIRRAAELKAHGLHYLDVGTSGGVAGLERGYCLMIGGEAEVARRLAPIFAALAPGSDCAPPTPGRSDGGTAAQGYLHCGPHGAGHFVKMVHNGIEYGLMAAYAEGLNILKNANAGSQTRAKDAETTPLRHPEHYQYDLDLPEIAELWRRGSVIGSWLLDLTARSLVGDPGLEAYAEQVADSGEGRWTIAAALEEGVPVPVLSAALFERFGSRGHDAYANRVLSAMRHQFGGHGEKAPAKKPE